MGRNAFSGCSLLSQEWSWQMLVVIFPLAYWHSSVMFSGAFLCCCFYSLTKIAIFSLHHLQLCTLWMIQVNLAFAVVLEIKPNAERSGQVMISVILMYQFSCDFIPVSLRGDIFHLLWHMTTSVTSPPPILVPWGVARADVTAHPHTRKTTSGISTGTRILCFLFPIVTQGRVSTRAGVHFSWTEAALCSWSIVCKAQRNPWSNTCSAFSCGATEKDRLEPITYFFGFLLYFLPAWNNMYWK